VNSGPLLEVENLTVSFPSRRGELRAVIGVSYSLYPQQTLAIVGESGSGKTVSCRALMGLLPQAAVVTGSARFGGAELLGPVAFYQNAAGAVPGAPPSRDRDEVAR